MSEARKGAYDIVMLDTAGRLHIDEELLAEAAAVRDIAKPKETLLVADALTGQDAVNLARAFDEKIGITGIVLTRIDGDGRGGAALSMRAVTGKPIKLMGTGEKLDGLEDFHPRRIAGRILGMGDVVSLVERAAQNIDHEKAKKIAERMRKGAFDMNDLADQLRQLEKMGGMGGVMKMLPGMGKVQKQLEGDDIDKTVFKRQLAIIGSMNKRERVNPKIIDGKRRKRIAAGSGTKVEEINKLLKMHVQMADMMKQMGAGKGMFGKMFGGKGIPSEAEMEAMQKELAGMDPNSLPPDLKDLVAGGGAGWRLGRTPQQCPTSRNCSAPVGQNSPALGGRPRRPSGSGWQSLQRPSRPRKEKMINSYSDFKGDTKMSLKIRLARAGSKKRPYYHIVVAAATSPRDGKYIDIVGSFNPLLAKDSADRVKLDAAKAADWLKKGAQPTDRVLRFLDNAGVPSVTPATTRRRPCPARSVRNAKRPPLMLPPRLPPLPQRPLKKLPPPLPHLLLKLKA